MQMEEQSFEFDRPSAHGLGPRTVGEGELTDCEAREALVDRAREAILAHYEPPAPPITP